MGWWSTGNRARKWNVTIRTNSIHTTQNPSWNFEIQTDPLIWARRPDLLLVTPPQKKKEKKKRKENRPNSGLYRPCRPQSKIEKSEKIYKYQDLARELKKYGASPSRLGLQNTPTAPLQRGKTPPTSFLDMTLNNLPGPLWPGVVAPDNVLSMG